LISSYRAGKIKVSPIRTKLEEGASRVNSPAIRNPNTFKELFDDVNETKRNEVKNQNDLTPPPFKMPKFGFQ